MSLQIWLPFTKDDSNYGILNMNPTSNTGKKVNSDHGGGYEFNNAEKQRIHYEHNAEINNFKSFSISCWAKNNVTEKQAILSLTYDVIIQNTGFFVLHPETGHVISAGSNIGINKLWHNYILTFNYDLQKFYYYLDGILTNELQFNYDNGKYKIVHKNGLIVGADSNDLSQEYYYFNGTITDVRVYNHCLSPLEIKQLSVGLIGHYPLNDEYITSTKNLCKSTFSANSETTWGWCTYTSEIVDIIDSKVPSNKGNKIVATFNGSTKRGGWSVLNTRVYVSQGDTYIYSLYVKSTIPINEINHNLLYIFFYNQESGLITEHGYKDNIINCGNGWYRCWGKVVIPEKCQFVYLYSFDYPSSGVVTYYLCAPQFEKSSELTPYTPSVREGSKYCYDISSLWYAYY